MAASLCHTSAMPRDRNNRCSPEGIVSVKIGLIAMSGVRACDERLLALGLTLPGFVERSQAVASMPSLGLLTLAGMTPSEHEIKYIEIEDIRLLAALPDGFDLVAISSFSAQMPEAY